MRERDGITGQTAPTPSEAGRAVSDGMQAFYQQAVAWRQGYADRHRRRHGMAIALSFLYAVLAVAASVFGKPDWVWADCLVMALASLYLAVFSRRAAERLTDQIARIRRGEDVWS